MPSLTIEQSQLYPDIADITKSQHKDFVPVFNVHTKLHTELKDLDSSDGVIVNTLYIYRDYINNISDYIEVQLTIPMGTYLYDVYPYLDNVEVTLITFKQKSNGKKPFVHTERYKAIYVLEKNTSIPTNVSQSKEDLNQNLPVVITLQLLDRSVETIRVKTTQGSFGTAVNPKNKDMSLKPFMKSLISEECDKILIENKPAIDQIFIEEPDNQDPLKGLTLSSGTRLIEVPEYLQNKNIGVYSGGIGNYIQTYGLDHFTFKKVFFVYSLFNPKKYDKAERKLLIYSPPSSGVAILDYTYAYEDGILKMVSQAIPKINDSKETSVMSTGGGYRTSNANSYMKKPVKMTTEGPVFERNQLNTEVIYKDRKDNLNFAPNKSISSNVFSLSAEVLHKQGNYIPIELNNVDHDFIYPGAPCKVAYESPNKGVREFKGVIHKAAITYSNSNPNMILNYNSKFVALTSHITLQVFVIGSEKE